MAVVTIEKIAKLLKLSERRAYQLAKDGIIIKTEKGKYNLEKSIAGYIDYIKPSSKENITATEDAQAMLMKAKAKKAEIELGALERRYINADEVEKEWSEAMLIFRNKMLALPNKCASLVHVGQSPAKVFEIINTEIRNALFELSRECSNSNEQKETTNQH